VFTASPVCSCAVFYAQASHTRPRVQRAPGIPCSLRLRRDNEIGKARAKIAPRDRETASDARTRLHTFRVIVRLARPAEAFAKAGSGRSSIPQTAMIEPRSRGLLDTRMRGYDDLWLSVVLLRQTPPPTRRRCNATHRPKLTFCGRNLPDCHIPATEGRSDSPL
jgi:hypothetical protein